MELAERGHKNASSRNDTFETYVTGGFQISTVANWKCSQVLAWFLPLIHCRKHCQRRNSSTNSIGSELNVLAKEHWALRTRQMVRNHLNLIVTWTRSPNHDWLRQSRGKLSTSLKGPNQFGNTLLWASCPPLMCHQLILCWKLLALASNQSRARRRAAFICFARLLCVLLLPLTFCVLTNIW